MAEPIDLFDNAQSRFERDRDYAKLQGQRLYWFSRSGVRLHTYREPAGDLTTFTNSSVLTDFVVKTITSDEIKGLKALKKSDWIFSTYKIH